MRMQGCVLPTVPRKSIRRRFVAGAFALLFLGCLSPTMPLPPPGRPTIEGPDSTGTVVLSGHINNATYVYADNLSTGYSAGQAINPEDGNYRFSIGARVGDYFSMYYRRGNDDSQARTFTIPEPTTTTSGLGAAGGAENSSSSGGTASNGGSFSSSGNSATAGTSSGGTASSSSTSSSSTSS
jgi:hypothetical protein